MIILAGPDIVLPDRIVRNGSLVIDEGRIVEIREGGIPADPTRRDLRGHLVVPGFIDVHVHGVEGLDALGPLESIGEIAARLVKYGVTAFCPTTIACGPQDLERALSATRAARRRQPEMQGARVLPAHLESNFINPDYRGAQPLEHLCEPPSPTERREDTAGDEILRVIDAYQPEVGIVTLAPELPHALPLLDRLVSRGIHVSLGHSGATLEQGRAGIEAGARQATHLFNRMPPLNHREPGLVGAVLESEDVAAEIVCDGYHVHPIMVRTAIAAKRVPRVMVITDGTAGAGLPVGSRVELGGRRVTVRETACFLDDGTLAGSRLTMDGAFRFVVQILGLSVVDAARLCATNQAEQLGLADVGAIRAGAVADLTVLGADLQVRSTYVGGQLAYAANTVAS
ncbi:MAG: N-acetylglucosamine-6-phosphate deacetylase [Luteitalea sp.]|nr:N-acetylglucosamine-6-phosphate deacetylase [Luteitalea sp.]